MMGKSFLLLLSLFCGCLTPNAFGAFLGPNFFDDFFLRFFDLDFFDLCGRSPLRRDDLLRCGDDDDFDERDFLFLLLLRCVDGLLLFIEWLDELMIYV